MSFSNAPKCTYVQPDPISCAGSIDALAICSSGDRTGFHRPLVVIFGRGPHVSFLELSGPMLRNVIFFICLRYKFWLHAQHFEVSHRIVGMLCKSFFFPTVGYTYKVKAALA